MYRKVDPAALLFAIFTVAFSPLISKGPWDRLNTVIAVVVGAVLLAFTWPRKATLQDESGKITPVDPWITLAQAIAYGLVIAIGMAWIVQSIWLQFVSPPLGCNPETIETPPFKCTIIAGYATWVALGIGAVAGGVLFICMRRKIKKIIGPPLPAARFRKMPRWRVAR